MKIKIRYILGVVLGSIFVGCGDVRALGSDGIDLADMLGKMLDRSTIAEFPEPEFICKQASSYNRKSRAPGNPDWFVGSDSSLLRDSPFLCRCDW